MLTHNKDWWCFFIPSTFPCLDCDIPLLCWEPTAAAMTPLCLWPWVLSAHPKHKCKTKREEIILNHLWPLSSASRAGRCWLSAASAQPNPNNSESNNRHPHHSRVTFQKNFGLKELKCYEASVEQRLSALNIDTGTSLLLWLWSTNCLLPQSGSEGQVSLQIAGWRRVRAASSKTETEEPVLCGLLYSGITGTAGGAAETACPGKALPEQQHPWKKGEVFTMAFPSLPVTSPAFHSSRWCPSIFPSVTHAGSVCQHVFLSWGELTLVRLSSEQGFRAWHQVLPDNTHCSSRAVCTHSLTHAPQALTGLQPAAFWIGSPCWDCSQTHHHTHYHTWFTNLHVFLSSQLLKGLIMSWKMFLFTLRPRKKSRMMLWLQVRLKHHTGLQWDFTHTQHSIRLSFLHLQRSGVARSLFTLLKTKLPHPPPAKPLK